MKTRLATSVLTLAAAAGWAQEKPKFEVASIRPFVPKPGSAGIGPPQSPEHLTTSMPLRSLVQRAYGLESYQLTGPDSLATRWTILANAAPGTTQAQQNLMLQSLLEERFHLTFHHEMKEFKAYDLVQAKGGAKLKDAIPTDGCAMGATSVKGKLCGPVSEQFGIAKAAGQGSSGTMLVSPKGLAAGRNVDLALLARVVRQELGDTVVIDQTGLEGNYDIRMQFAPINILTQPPFDDDSPLPTIFDALQQQLGLKLEPTKTMVEMTIVDHIDATPTDN